MKEIIIKSFKNKLIKTVFVDEDDYTFLTRWPWHLCKVQNIFYAVRSEKNLDGSIYNVQMHRVIMGVYDPKVEIDHKDGNGLNNTKENLRKCTSHQNKCNKAKKIGSVSKYKGVCVCSRKSYNDKIIVRWKGGIYGRGIKEPTKKFPFTLEGEIDAAKYYDVLAIKHYGEFARLNF